MTSVLCEDDKSASSGAEKKQEKRGIYGEGYGDFGGHHGWEEDHHHVHHHHEKTIVNVKKVPVHYPVEHHVPVPVHKTVHYPGKFISKLSNNQFDHNLNFLLWNVKKNR